MASRTKEVRDPARKSKSDLKSLSKKSERRLVEYFLVVSSVPRENDDKFDQTEFQWTATCDSSDDGLDRYGFQPTITSRYPLEDHEGNHLHESVLFFCHPSGSINCKNEACLPKVHYFVMTGDRGTQIYGVCLTLYEPYLLAVKPAKGGNDSPFANGKEIFIPKCLCILSVYPYLVAFREYLTQLHRLTKMGDMPLPVERYITNFCSEIPAPPPGSFEVQTTILDSVIKFWSPPHNQPIPWVSLPFSHLFECLDIENIIATWHALALERQVLVTCTQLSLLTTCCEILTSLLFPMRWSHAYIPVLPNFLIPMLSAPMPYLCGLDKANLGNALLDLSGECIVVDLDTNQITLGPRTQPLPPIPSGYANQLRRKLEENAGMVFREARSLTRNDDFTDRGHHLPIHVKLMADAMWESKLLLYDDAFHLAFTPEQARKNFLNGNDNSGIETSERSLYDSGVPFHVMTSAEKINLKTQSKWDAVQEAFVWLFVCLLRNYRKYLVFPSKEGSDSGGSYGGAGFRLKEFVQSQRYDTQNFLEELLSTQMFDNFVTKRLYGSGAADVAFFDQAVDKFLKHHGLMTDVAGHALGSFRRLSAESAYVRKSNKMAVTREPSTSKFRRMFNRSSNEKKSVDYDAPLLQSARVHRKLKTIVPPEPSGADLPQSHYEVKNVTLANANIEDDDQSVTSTSTAGTHSTKGTRSTVVSSTIPSSGNSPPSPSRSGRSGYSSSYQRRQKKLAENIEKEKKCHMYSIFPPKLDESLFGSPRPLPSAVIEEFDRQRENAAKFRRRKLTEDEKDEDTITGRDKISPEISAEVKTFTVFFMSFTAVVGKKLLDLSYTSINGFNAKEKVILSTYNHSSRENSGEERDTTGDEKTAPEQDVSGQMKETNKDKPVTDNGRESISNNKLGSNYSSAKIEDQNDADNEENKKDLTFKELVNNFSKETGALPLPTNFHKANRNSTKTLESVSKEVDQSPRNRFRDSLDFLQIEEAKATAKAQLGLAFEMLTVMRGRSLKADPAAYQCLIDACGRCGDTKRATELLVRMHEDGIVADGVVYSCLVSAFSAESIWRKVSGKVEEELPEWANGASGEINWNKLQERTMVERARSRFGSMRKVKGVNNTSDSSVGKRIRNIFSRKERPDNQTKSPDVEDYNPYIEPPVVEKYVTDSVLRQVLFGESLLEIVYPDISIDTDNEFCPRCNSLLSDDDVVGGWTTCDSQDYTTKCPVCPQKFVPHFCVQSSSQTFTGSRGPGTPLLCERLSPWVLEKEIRNVMHDREGVEDLLDPLWREKEPKNAVLWWNLILSFIRYKLPFTFLLQASFEQNLIAPSPDDENVD